MPEIMQRLTVETGNPYRVAPEIVPFSDCDRTPVPPELVGRCFPPAAKIIGDGNEPYGEANVTLSRSACTDYLDCGMRSKWLLAVNIGPWRVVVNIPGPHSCERESKSWRLENGRWVLRA